VRPVRLDHKGQGAVSETQDFKVFKDLPVQEGRLEPLAFQDLPDLECKGQRDTRDRMDCLVLLVSRVRRDFREQQGLPGFRAMQVNVCNNSAVTIIVRRFFSQECWHSCQISSPSPREKYSS